MDRETTNRGNIVFERAARDTADRALAESLDTAIARLRDAFSEALTAWEVAESAGLNVIASGYPEWMPSLDEAAVEVSGLYVAAQRPGQRFEAEFSVGFYAKGQEEANDFVRELGDELIQTERVVTIKGGCYDVGTTHGWHRTDES